MDADTRSSAHAGGDAVDMLVALERALLGGVPSLTRQQVAELAGIDLALAERLWTAMGFVSLGDDEVAFTEADVDALRTVARLQADTGLDADEAVALARTNSHHLAAIADAEAAVSAARLARGADPATEAVAGLAAAEHLLRYVWKRQLFAAALRTFGDGIGGTSVAREGSVGFADLVGFTSVSRDLDEAELLRLVERFDAEARERVTRGGGRVIKTIGDEVLFVAPTPGQAGEIALSLLEIGDIDGMPPLRAGVAHGEVLLRHGDVFGAVVNIASRLVSVARPGTVLLDRNAAAVLESEPEWEVIRLRPHRVRGYAHLVPYVLRRSR
jgi:adenylate cyclase